MRPGGPSSTMHSSISASLPYAVSTTSAKPQTNAVRTIFLPSKGLRQTFMSISRVRVTRIALFDNEFH